jgi:hypothetical protein
MPFLPRSGEFIFGIPAHKKRNENNASGEEIFFAKAVAFGGIGFSVEPCAKRFHQCVPFDGYTTLARFF